MPAAFPIEQLSAEYRGQSRIYGQRATRSVRFVATMTKHQRQSGSAELV